jgi:hypothetical protein
MNLASNLTSTALPTGAAPTERIHIYGELMPETETNGRKREDVPPREASAAAAAAEGRRVWGT